MKRFAVAVALALIAACSRNDQSQAGDAALASAVQARLIGVSADALTHVHVIAVDGTVAISGTARNASERASYVAAASTIDGVRSVRDRLVLAPNMQGPQEQIDDIALKARVSAAIAGQAGVNAFHVTPNVHGGFVTLRGSVPSKSIDATIVDTVAHLAGVKHVDDRIAVR